MTDKNCFGINKLCGRCIRQCKQPDSIVMLDCPRFQARPFKSKKMKFEQMDLFDCQQNLIVFDTTDSRDD